MNGCVMVEESVYHSYGLSVSGTVGALSFTEEYKKTELSLSGFYNYQSGVKGNPSIKINPFIFIKFLQSGLDGIFKWLDMPFDGDMNDVMKDAGFRSAFNSLKLTILRLLLQSYREEWWSLDRGAVRRIQERIFCQV